MFVPGHGELGLAGPLSHTSQVQHSGNMASPSPLWPHRAPHTTAVALHGPAWLPPYHTDSPRLPPPLHSSFTTALTKQLPH